MPIDPTNPTVRDTNLTLFHPTIRVATDQVLKVFAAEKGRYPDGGDQVLRGQPRNGNLVTDWNAQGTAVSVGRRPPRIE
jgi:hypothetical protein